MALPYKSKAKLLLSTYLGARMVCVLHGSAQSYQFIGELVECADGSFARRLWNDIGPPGPYEMLEPDSELALSMRTVVGAPPLPTGPRSTVLEIASADGAFELSFPRPLMRDPHSSHPFHVLYRATWGWPRAR
jgi:hypothetical protein